MKRFLFVSLAVLCFAPAISVASVPTPEDPAVISALSTAPDLPAVLSSIAITTVPSSTSINRALSAQKGSTAMSQTPSIGRIVHYRLSARDEEAIARRRTTGASIAERIPEGKWPVGAQAHVGNPAVAGATVPLIISAVWPDEYGPGKPGVNGQAILDGNDQLWVTSAGEGSGPGEWSWPPRV